MADYTLPTDKAEVEKVLQLLDYAKSVGLTVDDLDKFFRTALERAEHGDK